MKTLSTLVTFALLSLPSMGLILGEYSKMLKRCQAGGDETACQFQIYIAVKYTDNVYRTYAFGDCYTFDIDGGIAELALFCKATTCFLHPNPDCSGGVVPPVPIPIPAITPIMLANPADFIEFVGKSVTCQKNILS